MLAPPNIAAGITNIFATTCWNPIATNVIIGNHVPNIFPLTSFAQNANHAPIPTSQLHPIPEKIISEKVALILASAVWTVFSKTTPSVRPVKCPKQYATNNAPTKLANVIITKFFNNNAGFNFLSNTANVTAIILLVINSPPPTKIQISPIGKTAAPKRVPSPPQSWGIVPATLI